MRRIVVATVALLTVALYVVGARAQHVPPPITVIIAADGSALLPNAANPSPYLSGEEIAVAGALPPGMISEVEYENHRFTSQPGDILTFVSDGVIEATKSDTGELFGFDRICALSCRPALEIAQTARVFGQTDDITVLTVSRLLEVPA